MESLALLESQKQIKKEFYKMENEDGYVILHLTEKEVKKLQKIAEDLNLDFYKFKDFEEVIEFD